MEVAENLEKVDRIDVEGHGDDEDEEEEDVEASTTLLVTLGAAGSALGSPWSCEIEAQANVGQRVELAVLPMKDSMDGYCLRAQTRQ